MLNKINWKHIIILSALVIIAGSGILWFSTKQKTNPSRLEFSTGVCDSSIDPYSKPNAGIINQKWLAKNTLLVEGFLKTFCGGVKIKGNHEVKDEKLILTYKIETGEAVTSCLCAHKIIYQISNLARKNYQISLVAAAAESQR